MKKTLIIIAIIAIPLLIFIGKGISVSNNEVRLRATFKQKTDERTAFYDGMWKTLSQKSQIAIRNDSSFRQNVNIIMTNRQDAEGVMMKWITESNPNANYSEVSALYKDLSRTVEAKRDEFFQQEKMMQDVVLQHDILLNEFPGNVWFAILGRDHLQYKPITSDRTDGVIKSGKDNDTKLF